MKATVTHNSLQEVLASMEGLCVCRQTVQLLLSLKAVLLFFLLPCSFLLLFLVFLVLVSSCGGAGVVSVVDDVFGVGSRRTEVLLREDLVEDGLSLSDGVFVSQASVWSRAHVHVGWEVMTFDLQPRTVGHVEVQAPEDRRTVFLVMWLRCAEHPGNHWRQVLIGGAN